MASPGSVDAHAATFNIEGVPLLRQRVKGDRFDVLPTGPGASVSTEPDASVSTKPDASVSTKPDASDEDSKLVKLARDRTLLAEERTQLIILQSIVGIMGFSVATSRVYIAVGKKSDFPNWEVVTILWFVAASLWFVVYAITEAKLIGAATPKTKREEEEGTNDTSCWTRCADIASKCIRVVLCVLIPVAMVFTMLAIRNDFSR